MTPEQKESCNKFLTLWLKECWHIKGIPTAKVPNADYYCTVCSKYFYSCDWENPNYFTEIGFWIIWKAARKSEEWEDFWLNSNSVAESFIDPFTLSRDAFFRKLNRVNPSIFALEWAKFLGWEEN